MLGHIDLPEIGLGEEDIYNKKLLIKMINILYEIIKTIHTCKHISLEKV